MSESEKPFTCTVGGCNMSFVNEDHLTFHQKKHDMMLNLGSNNKSNFFIVDQTPTPTRFIRNCEEVGLFQALNNENPFEETFRRAVEAKKTGSLTVPPANENDDTLHTPNIFPHITEDVSTTSVSSKTKEKSKSSPTDEKVPNKVIKLENAKNCAQEYSKMTDSSALKKQTINSNEPKLPFNQSSTNKPESLPTNEGQMQLLLKTQDGKVLRFVAAPVANNGNSINIQPTPNRTKPSILANKSSKPNLKVVKDGKISTAKMKLKQALNKNSKVMEKKATSNNEKADKSIKFSTEKSGSSSDSVKKQAILERNRASSMRARAKRKAWIEQLQQSLKNANETNANLQTQLKTLHVQIDKLKALLLAHKDCPVTKAMEKGNGIVVGSKVLAIKPNTVQQVPIVVKPAVKRIKLTKPIVPIKKSIILPTVTSPIILPKSNATGNTITLHAAGAVKPIPTMNIVTPLVMNTGNVNTMLLNPNFKKVSLVQSNLLINKNSDKNNKPKILNT